MPPKKSSSKKLKKTNSKASSQPDLVIKSESQEENKSENGMNIEIKNQTKESYQTTLPTAWRTQNSKDFKPWALVNVWLGMSGQNLSIPCPVHTLSEKNLSVPRPEGNCPAIVRLMNHLDYTIFLHNMTSRSFIYGLYDAVIYIYG